MSLINDALKRATQSPASSPTAPVPEPKTPMQPVDYQNRGSGLPWYFFPALLLVLAGACWFLIKGIHATRQAAGHPLIVQAREPEPAPSPADTALAADAALPVDNSAAAAPAPIPNRNFSLDDAPSASAAPAPESTPAPPPAPVETPKPAIKLQGIFYRTGNPSAMLNGKSVTVGSRVGGATVRAITRDSVTLDLDGQMTVLTLE